MDNLAIALSTIPFYERNCIDQSLFSETDILNMNNRATKFKEKYYNDKSYTTPEMEVQDRILKKLRESEEKESTVSDEKEEVTKDVDFTNLKNKNDIEQEEIKTTDEKTSKPSPVKFNNLAKIEPENIDTNEIKEIESVKQIVKIEEKGDMKEKSLDNKHIDNIDDIIAVVENKKVETPKKSEPKTIVDTAVVTTVVESK